MHVEIREVVTEDFRDRQKMEVSVVWERNGGGVWHSLSTPFDAPPDWAPARLGQYVRTPLVPYVIPNNPLAVLATALRAGLIVVETAPVVFDKMIVFLGTPMERVTMADGSVGLRQWIGFAGRS